MSVEVLYQVFFFCFVVVVFHVASDVYHLSFTRLPFFQEFFESISSVPYEIQRYCGFIRQLDGDIQQPSKFQHFFFSLFSNSCLFFVFLFLVQ